MKLAKTFLLFVTVFFISTNIFSQREDVLERIKRIPHNPNINFPDETLTKDAFLNAKQKRTSKINVLVDYEVVDSIVSTFSDGKIKKYKFGFNSNGNMTSYLIENWDGTNWVNSARRTYTYDSNKNLITDLSETWSGTNWVNTFRYTHTYDSSGNVTSDLRENSYGGVLVNSNRYTYTYDNNGKLLSYLDESWNGVQWEINWKSTYIYDSNGNMISYLDEYWNGTEWENTERETYTYDSNGNKILYLNELWTETDWLVFWRYDYIYDSNGNLISYIYYEREEAFRYRKTYIYDSNGNLINRLTERGNGTDWRNYWRETNTFDPNGKKILTLYERWDGSNWVNSYQDTYVYNNNGNTTLSLNEHWEGANWLLWNDITTYTDSLGNSYFSFGAEDKIYYKTIKVEENETEIMNYSLSQNYPNPFNPSTIIEFSIPSDVETLLATSLKIYNTLGQQVAELLNKPLNSGNYEVEFNASHFASGVYFYRLQSGSFTETKKMIFLR